MHAPNNEYSAIQLKRSRAVTGILEQTIASLELTAEQRKSVEETYLECGAHLSRALGLGDRLGDIFPQGSMRLGTVIRPYRDITEVFDLDLVFRLAMLRDLGGAVAYREAIGRHLKKKYGDLVKPLPKGWRLDYAEKRGYYLDVIPAKDSTLGGDGDIIAITDDVNWRESNPRGYARDFFDRIAAKLPEFEKLALFEEGAVIANSARFEPLPEHTHFKSPLQRITQISKRYRDYYFNKKTNTPNLATPSIVLTTMLSLSYERLVRARSYTSGFDLLLACVEEMPEFIEVRQVAAQRYEHWLANPSLPQENLIEKWKDARYERAFRAWHTDYVSFLRQLLDQGESPRTLLTDAFGAPAVAAPFAKQAKTLAAARTQGNLIVGGSGAGLSLAAAGTVGAVSSTHVTHGIR